MHRGAANPPSADKTLRYYLQFHARELFRYFLFYRAFGKTWIEYYQDRLDGELRRLGDRVTAADHFEGGKRHLDFLKEQGLRPEHRVLDYGCGFMRLGVHLAKYLRPGNYVGLDISAARLERGRAHAAEFGVATGSFTLHHVSDCKLSELTGQKFDVVWAKSVLTHMPKADIEELLIHLKPVLASGGRFFFTFQPAKPAIAKVVDYFYPADEMRLMCNRAGYHFALVTNWNRITEGDVLAVASPDA